MIGVEKQPHHVGRSEVVTAGEDSDDAVGVRIESAHENVEVARIIGDFRFGRQLRGPTFGGPPLLEFRDGLCLAPDGVVVAPVDDWRLRGARGRDALGTGRRPRARWASGMIRRLPGKRDGCEEGQRKQHDGFQGGFLV